MLEIISDHYRCCLLISNLIPFLKLIPFKNLIHFLKWDHLSRIRSLSGIWSLPKCNPFSLVIILSKAHEHKSARCRFYTYMNNPNCTGLKWLCSLVWPCGAGFFVRFFFLSGRRLSWLQIFLHFIWELLWPFLKKMLEWFSLVPFCSEFKVLLLFVWLPPKATNPSLFCYLTCNCRGSRDELLLLKWS